VSGIRHRRKGNRIERELVHRHRELGLRCERYPSSGATRFRGAGHDLDVYLDGPDAPPAAFESKARRNGEGFAQLTKWLADHDGMFLRQNAADPLVVLPWRTWAALVRKQ
jgi:hypothetical protein